MILEACANSAISALEAQRGGADRVELCENMTDGGGTPSAGSLILARKYLTIQLFVMIRPRGADFLYTDEEFEIMIRDIGIAKSLGADGVVFGILMPDGRIDIDRMKELMTISRPMGVTCHRAFDMTRDPVEALDALIETGVDRVLTSGQANSALEGAPLIRQLIMHGQDKITIMPGHGIKEHNLIQIVRETCATEYHLYLTSPVQSRMTFIRNAVQMGKSGLSEYEHVQVDATRIRHARELLNNYKAIKR